MSDTIKKYKIQQLIDDEGTTFVTLHPKAEAKNVSKRLSLH